jgi:hypothetical protein
MGWNYRAIKSLVLVDDDTVEPRFAIHEVHYKEDNDDHPVMMTPPVTPTTDDIRWVVDQLVRAVNKPALEIEGADPGLAARLLKVEEPRR